MQVNGVSLRNCNPNFGGVKLIKYPYMDKSLRQFGEKVIDALPADFSHNLERCGESAEVVVKNALDGNRNIRVFVRDKFNPMNCEPCIDTLVGPNASIADAVNKALIEQGGYYA